MTEMAKKAFKGLVNVAAERAVLAGLCQMNQNLLSDINEIVDVNCFTSNDNQIFFSVIKDILQDTDRVDMPSIIAKATMMGHTEVVADKNRLDYIKSLFNFNVTADNAKRNAVIIKKLSVTRDMQNICREIQSKLNGITGAESLDSILALLEKPVFDFTARLGDSDDDKTVNLMELLPHHIDLLAEAKLTNIGIPSPWPIYNEAIGGGRRKGYVYLIGARPKVGKSSFAINDAIHQCKLNIPVLYLDTEMSKEDTMNRLIASLSNIHTKAIERGEFSKNDFLKSQVFSLKNKYQGKRLEYHKVAGKPFDEIISIVRRWIMRDVGMNGNVANDCLVIYDYFKLMDANVLKEMQEYQALGFQIQELTNFCNKYGAACAAYVQLNQEGKVSQSDRLTWLCSSVSFLQRKDSQEILASGPTNGNMKLVVTPEQRFGPGLDDNDWINFKADKDKCIIEELGTRSNEQKNDGIAVVEGEEDGEVNFDDDDFDRFDFGDSKYRTD